MTRTKFTAIAAAFVCLSGFSAHAQSMNIITLPGAKCQVPKPDDVAAPATPSVAAGTAAINSKNYALAEANFRPVAEKGDVVAERDIGQLLMQNCTGLQDKAAAVDWLGKAADGGDVTAQMLLGNAYMNGDGVAQDDTKAFGFLSKAAALGNVAAQRNLGYLYLSGRGTEVDKYQGMVWSVKAGEQGDGTAISNIAVAYLNGQALPQDFNKAAFYIAVALLHAPPTDLARLLQTRTNISDKLSQNDMQTVANRAKDWSPGAESLSSVLRDAQKRRDQKS